MHRLLDTRHRAAQIDLTRLIVQVIHRRMRQIIGAKDHLGLACLVRHIFVGDRHDRQDHALGVAQGDVLTGGDLFGKGLVDVQRHRNGPQMAVRSVHALDNTVVIGLGMKALQRVEPAVHQKFKVADLTRGQIPRGQRGGLMLQFLCGVVGNIKLRQWSMVVLHDLSPLFKRHYSCCLPSQFGVQRKIFGKFSCQKPIGQPGLFGPTLRGQRIGKALAAIGAVTVGDADEPRRLSCLQERIQLTERKAQSFGGGAL